MPARDTPSPPAGTARIRGRVVAADTGVPLRRAQIRVTAGEIRVMRSATTDADGRYEVAGLPAGRYAIFVARNGFVSLQFGQQRPFEPGRPLDVAEAQVHDRIDFALPRGGVIAGRVTDELGEPVAGVRMTALRHRYMPNGERQLMPSNPGGMFNMVTNDLGEFRVFGLMPGAYLLSADPDDGGFMSIQGGVMPPGTATSGEVDGYATTYYPGTVNADEAQPITVGIAETATATFALSTARLAQVSGVVRNSAGAPLSGARVMLRARNGFGGFSRGGPPVGPDGRFTITGVPPGDYSIDVMPSPMDIRSGAPELGESGSLPITVAGSDITDAIVTTSPGATITGQVIFKGASTSIRPDRVMLQSADPRSFVRIGPNDGAIDANGRFQLRGASGRVLFRTMQRNPAEGPGWTLNSVTFNGVDITDTPLDLAAVDDASGIEIVVTDTFTTISGTAVNAQRSPVKDYVVVIFPDRLKEGAVPMRFIRSVRPDQEGRYQVRGLPAGEYLAVAVPTLEAGDEWDPAFRKRVEPLGKRFRLSDGQTTNLELQLNE